MLLNISIIIIVVIIYWPTPRSSTLIDNVARSEYAMVAD